MTDDPETFDRYGECVIYTNGTITWTPEDADHTRISRQLLVQLRDDLTAIARIRAILAGWDDDEGGHSPDSHVLAELVREAMGGES